MRRVLVFARHAPAVVGSPWAFTVVIASCVAWLVTGPLFGWSDSWLLLPATATSIGAFLLVVLLQYTQNRDTRVLQLKLDELLRAVDETRTQLIQLEHSTDEELEAIEEEFAQLRREEDLRQ